CSACSSNNNNSSNSNSNNSSSNSNNSSRIRRQISSNQINNLQFFDFAGPEPERAQCYPQRGFQDFSRRWRAIESMQSAYVLAGHVARSDSRSDDRRQI